MRKIKIFAVIILAAFILIGCGSVKLNQTGTIERDNIKITVLGSEDVTINRDGYTLANGEYTKVKLTIENIGTETYAFSTTNFMLGEETPSIKTLTEEDYIKQEIAPSESASGYIYFPKTDATELTYTSLKLEADSKGNVSYEKEIFKIK